MGHLRALLPLHFSGAPYIERLRNNKAVSGALAAITAAVVGVILNLAIWFGMDVLFSGVERVSWGPFNMALPVLPSIDWIALALCILAGVLVFRTRLGMLSTLALLGFLGLAVGVLP